MKASLTERYITATITQLPEDLRGEVEPELRASITDAVDARVAQGDDPESAERAVLNDLGDPVVLAAGYADRPLQLIGPKYYVAWSRLLKRVLLIIPPIVLVVAAFAQILAGGNVGQVIAEAVLATISTILHVCFWVTLAFAVMERTGTDLGISWDVDHLPEPKETRAGLSDMIGSLVFLGLLIAAIFWDQTVGFVRVLDERIPILNPDLWPWAMAAFFGLIVLEIIFAVVLYIRRGWDTLMAVANTLLSVAFFTWIVSILARGELLSTEFTALFVNNGLSFDTLYTVAVIVGFIAGAIALGDIIDGWVKTYRAASSASVEQEPAAQD